MILSRWRGRSFMAGWCRLLLGELWLLFGALWWRSLGWRTLLLGLPQVRFSGLCRLYKRAIDWLAWEHQLL